MYLESGTGKKWLLPAFSSLSEMSTRALILQQALGYGLTFPFGQVSLMHTTRGYLEGEFCPSCTPPVFCPSEVHVQASALKDVTEPLTCLREVTPPTFYDNVASTPS